MTSSEPPNASASTGGDDYYYESMDLEDLDFDEDDAAFRTECPCGDKFFITVDDLLDNEIKGTCPSCSLVIEVKYDPGKVRERFGEEAQ